jgi:catalase
MVGVVVSEGADLSGVAELRAQLEKEGAQLLVIAAHGGVLGDLVIERTFLTVRSIEFDAVAVAGGTETGGDLKVQVFLAEAYRHCKPVLAWGSGVDELLVAGIDTERPGVLVADRATDRFDALKEALGLHRVWDRFPEFMLG